MQKSHRDHLCYIHISGITYDISNKHRLGYSEVQLVQCMIDGVSWDQNQPNLMRPKN